MSGKPVIVINPNGLEYQALNDLNMSIDDIMEMLRQNGFYSLDQISYAIIETNGKLSIIPSTKNTPVTTNDLQIKTEEAKLPHIIIFDGKINTDELKKSNLTIMELNKIFSNLNIEDIKNIIVFTIDESGKIYYQLKGQKCQMINNIKI